MKNSIPEILERFEKEVYLRKINKDNPQYVLGWNLARELAKTFFKKELRKFVEGKRKEKKYGGTLAIEASTEIYQLGKRFNRLTIEKIVENKLQKARQEERKKLIR